MGKGGDFKKAKQDANRRKYFSIERNAIHRKNWLI